VLNSDFTKLNQNRVLIIDGAMGTQIQNLNIPKECWGEAEGCNELLNETFSDGIAKIHKAYLTAGADIIKTNTFGSMPWVLDEYGLSKKAYSLSYLGAKIVKEQCEEFSSDDKQRFCAASIGPGTKLPSLGHIEFDEMQSGYEVMIDAVMEGGADLLCLKLAKTPCR